MYRVELHNGIKKIIVVFNLLGFWDNGIESPWNKTTKIFLYLFYASLPVSVVTGALNCDTTEESVFLLVIAIATVVQLCKLFFIIWKRREILAFIADIGSISIDDRTECNEIDKKINKYAKLVENILFMFSIESALIFVFDAVSEEKRLLFNIGFPLDWKNSDIGYWTAFAYIVIQFVYCIVIFLMDIITWYLMVIFSTNYELLGNKFKRMGTIKTSTKIFRNRKLFEIEKKNLFLSEFIAGVQLHQKIRE